MSKYAELLKASKQDQENALAPARATQVAAEVGLAIAQLDVQLKTLSNELDELKGGYPLDLDAIRDKLDEVAIVTREQEQLKALSVELFGA